MFLSPVKRVHPRASARVILEFMMAPSPLDKQPAGYKSPPDLLVRLGVDLAVLCVMPVEPKLAPNADDAIWLFSVQMHS